MCFLLPLVKLLDTFKQTVIILLVVGQSDSSLDSRFTHGFLQDQMNIQIYPLFWQTHKCSRRKKRIPPLLRENEYNLGIPNESVVSHFTQVSLEYKRTNSLTLINNPLSPRNSWRFVNQFTPPVYQSVTKGMRICCHFLWVWSPGRLRTSAIMNVSRTLRRSIGGNPKSEIYFHMFLVFILQPCVRLVVASSTDVPYSLVSVGIKPDSTIQMEA